MSEKPPNSSLPSTDGMSPSDPRLEIPEVLRTPVKVPAMPDRAGKSDSGLADMARAWGTALDFLFTIFAGAAIGWAFDKWRGTAPKGLMVGLALGFVVAFVRIVRSTQKQERTKRK